MKLSKVPLLKSAKVLKVLSKEALIAIETQLTEVLKSSYTEGYISSFILLEYSESTKQATICSSFQPLFEEFEGNKPDVIHYIAYVDPTNQYPSVILKNIIGAIGMNLKKDKKQIRFISIRDKISKESTKVEFKDSLYFEISVEKPSKLEYDTWMLDEKSQPQQWNIDLKQVMDREL